MWKRDWNFVKTDLKMMVVRKTFGNQLLLGCHRIYINKIQKIREVFKTRNLQNFVTKHLWSEDFFHSILVKINEDSLNKNIRHETFKEFSERVKSIIVNYPTLKINKIIDSMDKWINMIIEHKAQRIKYWWKFHL